MGGMHGEKSRTPVFLVADNVVVCEGLRWLIERHGGFLVVNTNGDAFPAVRTRDGVRVAVIVRAAPGAKPAAAPGALDFDLACVPKVLLTAGQARSHDPERLIREGFSLA